ncbi:MAG: RTX toxin, partial [Alphaproteobacteria bacterium]|nr:RTX toxin [Alphaproteobacteria bacterium]
DADTTQDGDQAFAFIGGDAFGHHAGELRAEFDQVNNVWTVQGDVDGDGQADFTLHVTTLGGHQIVATDFMV